MTKPLRLVFMGTPEISAVCLKELLTEEFDIAGVYTQPDRPKNRGMKLQPSPVKTLALENGLPVFQPESFRRPETVEELRALRPDIIAVVAYGRILPQAVLDIPRLGCVNIHTSLLPEYRGPAPYQWAVLDGRTETGVTAMYLSLGMDEGDLIDAVKTPIYPEETAGQLLERLSVLGAELLRKTLLRLAQGPVPGTPQDGALATYAPMLDKSMAPIDFSNPARRVCDQIRGLHPWPVATAVIGGTSFKIHAARPVEAPREAAPGTVLGLTKTGLVVACGEGAVEIRTLQAQGGKAMPAPDYFRGHPLPQP